MNVKIDNSWREHIGAEFEKPYFAQLTDFVRQEYSTTACYPPGSLVFNAFNLCPFDAVKVVIIGQDPYHEPGQAQGLSFSVPAGVPFPPSLQNIFKEIQLDLGKPIPQTGDLTRWAKQGVLLLNAHGACASGGESSASRLGAVHRRCHQRAQCRARAPRVHSLGRLCALQEAAHRPRAPSRARVGASFAAVRQPRRMVRQPPLLALQRLSARAWRAGDRLVTRSAEIFFHGIH